ncbi:hypothetical protein [Halegenticoccus soli]|uniref:hypothetical protein n=1 Tax=Halegenticoccus soli TaxID=1985678 RepID=UPI00117A978A|nr:hypothetical protein [Halegenticoccus soli]
MPSRHAPTAAKSRTAADATDATTARVTGVRIRDTASGPAVELSLDNKLLRLPRGGDALPAVLAAFDLDTWRDAGRLFGEEIPVEVDERGEWTRPDLDALRRPNRDRLVAQ